MKILVTGAAGFIGFHLAKKLCERGDEVVGIDNLNDYYDPTLKMARLLQLKKLPNFQFIKMDITDREAMAQLFSQHNFNRVAHLAAQAGVRYSITDPAAYIDTNLVGFGNILEGCRQAKIEHLVFASSSSVYGANENFPFSEAHTVDHPLALYGATKKANEIMAHSYAHLFKLSCTGLRFFTVYGPWGRPDMALFKFTKAMLEGDPIDVYNFGDMARDFTYVDDIVEGIIRSIDNPAQGKKDWKADNPELGVSYAPYRIYNIGNGNPVKLIDFIETLEKKLNIKAEKNMLPLQPGDVARTYASTKNLEHELGYKPKIGVEKGVSQFVDWYLDYYGQYADQAGDASSA